MGKFPLQSGVSLLLSVMMLTNGIAPFGVQHAHAEGDKPHQHHGELLADEHDDEDHFHDQAIVGDESAHHGHECELVAGMIPHIHLTLLGYEFTLPTQDTPDDEEENPTDPVVVRLVDELYASRPTEQHPSELLPLLSSTLALDGVACFQTVIASSQPVTSQPLCDSARLERSGVRLI